MPVLSCPVRVPTSLRPPGIPDFNLGRSTSSSSEVNSQAASGPVRPPSRRSSESSEKRQVFVERPDGGVGATGQDGTDEEEAFQDPESKAKHGGSTKLVVPFTGH